MANPVPCPGVFLAPDTPVLPLFNPLADDQVPAVKSFNVSLKAFVVELKYNCPSCIWLNVAGADHSSVKSFLPLLSPPATNPSVLSDPIPPV